MSEKTFNTTTPFVNLIPDAHIAQRQRSRLVGQWVFAAISTAFMIGIPGVYIGGSAALTDSGMSGQIQTASEQYEQNQQAIPMLNTRLGLLIAEQEVLDIVKNRIDWGRVCTMLVDAADNDVRFRRLDVSGGGVEGFDPIEIRLDCLAPSQTIARAYIVELEELGVFDSVELIETRREQIDEFEVIGFQIMMSTGQANDSQGATNGG